MRLCRAVSSHLEESISQQGKPGNEAGHREEPWEVFRKCGGGGETEAGE